MADREQTELRRTDRVLYALAVALLGAACFAWGNWVGGNDARAHRQIVLQACSRSQLAAEIMTTGEPLCLSGSMRASRH